MKLENNVQKQEGLCLVCAKELGIKPVDDMMKKLGISEEELESMEKMVADLMPVDGEEDGDDDDSPTIDFGKLMRNAGFMGKDDGKDNKKDKDKGGKKDDQPTQQEVIKNEI